MDIGRPGPGSQERVVRRIATGPVTPRPCHACGAPVWDLRHEGTGRHAPIEVEPVANGTIAVDLIEGTYRMPGIDVRYPVGPRYQNHFAPCEQAARFRRGRPVGH